MRGQLLARVAVGGIVGMMAAIASAAQSPPASDVGSHSDEYAWRLFVTLNERTGHDQSAIDGPAAWESWAVRQDIFREDGANPGRWEDRSPASAIPQRFEVLSAKDLPNVRHVEGGKMVPGVGPDAQSQLTEVRFNRVAFDYLRDHRLYDRQGQLAQLQAHIPIVFPSSTQIIKARWRPIAEADRPRYHTLIVTDADGKSRLYGLVALHIATKTLPNWVWATFEHEDNPMRAGGEGWVMPSRDTFACRGRQPDCNRVPDGLGLEGSVWSHYRLRGTMTAFLDAKGQPQRLANSDLESGFQSSASCMTCHARAAVALIDGSTAHLPIFESTPDPLQRQGFVGVPAADWYSAGGAQFQSQDFIWTLALASAP